jgi:hypothetical protein
VLREQCDIAGAMFLYKTFQLPRNPRVPALVLQDVAKALQDPQLYDRAVRLNHVNPDDHALEATALFHLDCGDVTGALDILEPPWGGVGKPSA